MKKDGFMQELVDMSWENPKCTLESLLGVCGKEAAITDEQFSYFMGVRYDGESPENMEAYYSRKYMGSFSEYSGCMETFIFRVGPYLEYELANLPCIECYYGPKHKPRHELWVPVIPK